MGRRWSYPDLGNYDSNGNEIVAYLTITGINGINVAFDNTSETFLVNNREKLLKTNFKSIKEAQHYADPEFTKNPIVKPSRKTHLMVDYENDIYTLRKNNGDPIHEYSDANIMVARVKAAYPMKEVVIRMTIWP